MKWFVSKTAQLEGFTYAIEWSIHLQEFLFPSFAVSVHGVYVCMSSYSTPISAFGVASEAIPHGSRISEALSFEEVSKIEGTKILTLHK